MQKAWTDFAKNPSTGPQPGVWPNYTGLTTQLGVLGGSNNTSGLDVQLAAWTDYACPVYAAVLIPAGFAY